VISRENYVLIANSHGPKTSTNSPQGSGHASRLCRLSVLHRTFRAEQEGLQRFELTRSASSQRMAAICANLPLQIAALDASIGRRARL
jgi:hypothetical protein